VFGFTVVMTDDTS